MRTENRRILVSTTTGTGSERHRGHAYWLPPTRTPHKFTSRLSGASVLPTPSTTDRTTTCRSTTAQLRLAMLAHSNPFSRLDFRRNRGQRLRRQRGGGGTCSERWWNGQGPSPTQAYDITWHRGTGVSTPMAWASSIPSLPSARSKPHTGLSNASRAARAFNLCSASTEAVTADIARRWAWTRGMTRVQAARGALAAASGCC